MQNWRPDGWETLKAKNYPLHCFFPDACVGESFEAGADALLEKLRKKGYHTFVHPEDNGICLSSEGIKGLAGTLIFIPDDKTSDKSEETAP